jgi:YHS domain-containing protein
LKTPHLEERLGIDGHRGELHTEADFAAVRLGPAHRPVTRAGPLPVGEPDRTVAGCAPDAHDRPSTSPHGHHGGQQAGAPKSFTAVPVAGIRATCPVMSHTFTVKEGTAHTMYKGRYYAFCCPGRKGRFDGAPARFTGRCAPSTRWPAGDYCSLLDQ